MDKDRIRTVATLSIGTLAFGLLVAWMVPNTVPVQQASTLSGLSAQAAAQRATFSAVPANAIPANAGALPPPPDVQPVAVRPAVQTLPLPPGTATAADAPVTDTIAAGDPPPVIQASAAPPVIGAPPPPVLAAASPRAPRADSYAMAHAAWRAKMDAYAQQSSSD